MEWFSISMISPGWVVFFSKKQAANQSERQRPGASSGRVFLGSKPMTFMDFHIDFAGICCDDPIFCQICCESRVLKGFDPWPI